MSAISGSIAKTSTSPVTVGRAAAVEAAMSSGAEAAGRTSNWALRRARVVEPVVMDSSLGDTGESEGRVSNRFACPRRLDWTVGSRPVPTA
ncbi:Uncharacterised protein [Mycobacteroides abscessus subsp. abscessus]|nr:Uncharacterised protein [Mycobacteroides abscessus subsp. abscessus]